MHADKLRTYFSKFGTIEDAVSLVCMFRWRAAQARVPRLGFHSYSSSRATTVPMQVVMVDRVTRTPRGFGFITFKEPESATVAVQSGPHLIDDRLVRTFAATA